MIVRFREPKQMAYRFGPFVYGPVSRGLLHGGVEIALTHKSRELLVLFRRPSWSTSFACACSVGVQSTGRTAGISSEFRPGDVKGSAAKSGPRGASRLSVYYRQKSMNTRSTPCGRD